MRRAALALALALLVAVPVAAGPPPARAPSTTPTGSTQPVDPATAGSVEPTSDDPTVSRSIDPINVLALSGPSRSGFATRSIDVATTLTLQRAAAAGRLDRYALDDRIRNASSDDVRRQRLFDAMVDTKARSAELLDRMGTHRAAYANGSIDTAAFLDRVVRVHVRADNLHLYLDRIEGHAERIPEFSLERRLQGTEARLVGLRGPVGDRALGSIRGTSPATRFYVDVSPDGVVLSMITDGRYVREAYRADRRSENGETIGLDRVVDRMRILYPTVNETVPSGIQGLGGGVYRITFDLNDGTLVAYLDGETEDVFYENRGRQLEGLAGVETAEGVANGTRLVVNRSYPGAPLRIATVDDETGAPVEATVHVAGTRLETGSDGVVWTITPRTERFTVTAVRAGGNVTTFVRPLPTPALNVSV